MWPIGIAQKQEPIEVCSSYRAYCGELLLLLLLRRLCLLFDVPVVVAVPCPPVPPDDIELSLVVPPVEPMDPLLPVEDPPVPESMVPEPDVPVPDCPEPVPD